MQRKKQKASTFLSFFLLSFFFLVVVVVVVGVGWQSSGLRSRLSGENAGAAAAHPREQVEIDSPKIEFPYCIHHPQPYAS